MESLNHFNLRSFDLNLLLAFDALMQELSVTRAAARLKIQQPAMSHALSNLRMLFGDVLFVRVGHAMEATPRARTLYAAIHPILMQTQQALMVRTQFDPASEERTFRIGINGQLEAMIWPPLMSYLARHAPGLRIQSTPIGDQDPGDLLDEEKIDLAIGHVTDESPWHRRETLYREQHVCCFNPALLPFSIPLTAQQYFSCAHGVVSANDSLPGYLEHLLSHTAARPQIALATHSVMTLLATAASTPIVATLVGRVAASHAPRYGLLVSPLPFDVDHLQIDMIWHTRSVGDPAMDWLRDLVRTCAP